jgi:hypothetical protein
MLAKSKFRFLIFILISIAILLFPLIVRAQTPINCGQTLSASISAPAEKDSYSFSASANDGITIRTRKTSGTLTSYLELYSPGGSLLQSGTQIDRTLTETGSYRIDVRDSNNTNTGNYLLYWEKMNNPCNVAATLTCEQVVAGSIGTGVDPPPWRLYRFTASANDSLTIRTRNTSGSISPTMELYGASGSYITSGSQIDRTFTSAGTYTILMKDAWAAYAGNYVVGWWRVVNPCSSTPISCGQVLSGSISAADEIDMYTFTVSANDKVTIRTRKTSGNLNLNIELYNPSGTRIAGPAGSIETPLTLTAAGTYVLLVRDSSYINTGNYLLYWEKMNNPCNVTATLPTCEQVVAGSIGTGVDPPP